MKLTRREFIRTVGVTAGAAVVTDMLGAPGVWTIQRLEAAPLTPPEL